MSKAGLSLFAYPSMTKPPKKEAVIKVTTAVLSTIAKVKAKEKKKAAAEGDSMATVCLDIFRSILYGLIYKSGRES
jgi:26S proteasome regulatory subunit N2